MTKGVVRMVMCLHMHYMCGQIKTPCLHGAQEPSSWAPEKGKLTLWDMKTSCTWVHICWCFIKPEEEPSISSLLSSWVDLFLHLDYTVWMLDVLHMSNTHTRLSWLIYKVIITVVNPEVFVITVMMRHLELGHICPIKHLSMNDFLHTSWEKPSRGSTVHYFSCDPRHASEKIGVLGKIRQDNQSSMSRLLAVGCKDSSTLSTDSLWIISIIHPSILLNPLNNFLFLIMILFSQLWNAWTEAQAFIITELSFVLLLLYKRSLLVKKKDKGMDKHGNILLLDISTTQICLISPFTFEVTSC